MREGGQLVDKEVKVGRTDEPVKPWLLRLCFDIANLDKTPIISVVKNYLISSERKVTATGVS